MKNMLGVTKLSWKTIVWKTRRDPWLPLVYNTNYYVYTCIIQFCV